MNLASGIARQPNLHVLMMSSTSTSTSTSTQSSQLQPRKYSLKIKNLSSSWNPKANVSISGESLVSSSGAKKVRDKWMEFQGIKNWAGLLDPLDDHLRHEILRYGEFVEAAYRCFDFDTSSPTYATCHFPKSSMLSHCGLGESGYRVTESLHATCGAQLPTWAGPRVPDWASAQSSWIGYVAVCNDKDEIARLGRRDVVVAYRGTATCLEWLENLRVNLTGLPADMSGGGGRDAMVQSGFLSLYTSSSGMRKSLQESIREEIEKILHKYADEPLSITVTGHSLGAALATLTAHDIATTFKHAPLVTVVSFGGPRVGNKSFRRLLEKSGTKVLRIVNSDDPITKVPGFVLNEEDEDGCTSLSKSDVQKKAAGVVNWVQKRVEETQWVYAEIGEELRLSSKDCPDLSKGSVATCHDLKTYLHLVDNFVSSNCPLRATAKRVLERAQEEKQVLCG